MVCRCGFKSIGWILEQVDVGTCFVVDEMEITHVKVLDVDTEGINAILTGFEADRSAVFIIASHNSVVMTVFSDVNFGFIQTTRSSQMRWPFLIYGFHGEW